MLETLAGHLELDHLQGMLEMETLAGHFDLDHLQGMLEMETLAGHFKLDQDQLLYEWIELLYIIRDIPAVDRCLDQLYQLLSGHTDHLLGLAAQVTASL